jgi:hypothetical protein
MSHPIYRILECEHVSPYSLRLKFDDGLERVVDLEAILEGRIYGPLRDEGLFSKVQIDPEIQTVTWPNGADFDPAVLHDWPRYREDFIRAANNWRINLNCKSPAYA